MADQLSFVIIGAQKGGSTVLAAAAAEHPQISMPTSEVPVFRDPVYSDEAVGEFWKAASESPNDRAFGIKCPDYLGRPEAASRLSQLPTQPKLLACLRNPVDRAISHYFWQVRWGLLPLEDPNVGLTKVMDGDYAAVNGTASDILEWGEYAKHLATWRSAFSDQSIHVLLLEDLRRASTFADVFRFLYVDEDFVPTAQNLIVNEGVYPRQRLRFLRLRNRYVLHWYDGRSYANIFRPTRPYPHFVCNVVAAVDQFGLARIYGNTKPEISADVRTRLKQFYSADIERLEIDLGRSLAHWR